MDDKPSAMEIRARTSQHPGHVPDDPRVKMVEDMAADQCMLCSEGVHRWRGPDRQFSHVCHTNYEADECEAHNTLTIAVRHGVPIYTGAELEFPDETD